MKVITAVLFFLAAIPAQLLAAPAVTFAKTGVTISGITAGGKVALFVISHETRSYHLRIRSDETLLADTDGDGVVSYESAGAILRSVWVVADITSGEVAVTELSGPAKVTEIPPSAVRSSGARLSPEVEYLELLYVRPGAGAWRTTVLDGGTKDDDRSDDGFASVNLADLTAVGSSVPPPAKFREGDVVLAVDPVDLHVYSLGLRR